MPVFMVKASYLERYSSPVKVDLCAVVPCMNMAEAEMAAQSGWARCELLEIHSIERMDVVVFRAPEKGA